MVSVFAYISTFIDHRKEKETKRKSAILWTDLYPQQHSWSGMAFSITNGVCHVCASHSILSITIVWACEEPMWSLAGVATLARARWSCCIGPLLLWFSTQQIPDWWIHLLYPLQRKQNSLALFPFQNWNSVRTWEHGKKFQILEIFFSGSFWSLPQIMIDEVIMIDHRTREPLFICLPCRFCMPNLVSSGHDTRDPTLGWFFREIIPILTMKNFLLLENLQKQIKL